MPTNGAAYLQEVNPAITLGQTVGAGYFLQLEVPEQANLTIERFLSINPETSPRTARILSWHPAGAGQTAWLQPHHGCLELAP